MLPTAGGQKPSDQQEFGAAVTQKDRRGNHMA